MRASALILFLMLLPAMAMAQAPDSLTVADSVSPRLILPQAEGFRSMDTLETDTLLQRYFWDYYHYDTLIIEDSSLYYSPRLENIKARTRTQNPLFFVLFAGIFLLIALFRLMNLRNQSIYIRKLASFANEESFEDMGLFNLTFLQFFLIHVLVLGFGIYQGLFGQTPGMMLFLKIAAATAIIYALKYIIYWITGIALNFKAMSHAVISSTVTVNYLFALLLLPMLMIIYYSPSEKIIAFMYIALAVISVLYLTIRIFKSIVTHSSLFPYSIFHLFIYLCTFEIIPLLLVIKVVINNID